jgi:hypothetical protein
MPVLHDEAGSLMPSVWEDSWPLLINRRAAIREQFPSFAKVAKERPGSAEDREWSALYQAENRLSMVRAEERIHRAARSKRQREIDDEADADRLIAEMKQRQNERFLSSLESRGRKAS